MFPVEVDDGPLLPRREPEITVEGRTDWRFIKLHWHGLQSIDESAMLGTSIQHFLGGLVEGPGNRKQYRVHFVIIWEMVKLPEKLWAISRLSP
jgi:hypothetical protein